MNLSQIIEAKLFALLGKIKEEQTDWLTEKDILQQQDKGHTGFFRVESLPDLAERLWEKALKISRKTNWDELLDAMHETLNIIPEGFHFDQFWMYYAKPIHRIVASLLAMKRARKEMI